MAKPNPDLDYRLVVPSRGRPENMGLIQALLPTATIVVAEAEKDRYLQEVDAVKLVTHPGEPGGIVGLPRVYNWLQENFTEETLIEIDDDLQNVFLWAGEGAKKVWTRLKNPEDILQVIENGVQIAQDLDITCFCWSKSQNTAFIKADHKPIVPTGLVANAFGVRGGSQTSAIRPRYDWPDLSRLDAQNLTRRSVCHA